MDAGNNLFTHRLVESKTSQDSTKTDFRTAMQRMGFESVFDITRLTKAQFTLDLAKYCDADAGQAYNNALSYARQITRLYQEHQLSSGGTKQRVPRSIGSDSTSKPATYQALFSESWEQFCKNGDIAAIDSPVAYLRALYLFAERLENSSPRTDKKITLEKRRPDLKELILDQQSTFSARPMLSIVNDTLRSNIAKHLTATGEEKTVHEVLANEHYPFSLPYDLHHHQCLLGLGLDKPPLGALNYQVSLELPFSKFAANYGHVKGSRSEAQRLWSGLSPEQQRLLIAATASDSDFGVLKKAYGTENIERLQELEFFKERTGLTTEQVEQALAQGRYRPQVSTDSPMSDHLHYGAGYINGPEQMPALKVVEQAKSGTEEKQRTFINRSKKRFDRLQRMIRLQRWTDIPFAELDTLIVNALRSERSTSMELDTNTLRTLGVYRYLNQRHGIPPEEFASLLHDMPTCASADGISLFDQVFNRTQLLESPLKKQQTKDLVIAPPGSQQTFSYLSAGLGLPVTQDSLLLLAQQSEKYLSSLKHDLPTVSSIYRQARIARMFGLSPLECMQLARLLGGEAFCKLLVTGALSAPGTPTTDILDMLMAMDWAVDWLKPGNRDVAQWCRLFDKSDLALNQDMQKRLQTLQTNTSPSEDQTMRQVESLLHDIADLTAEYVPGVMLLAGTSTTKILMDIKILTPGKMPESLAMVLRATEACQGLHLSSSALLTLMSHPTWLASDSPGTLTPHTLYLLERFSHCARHQAQSEENLLHYLDLANQVLPQAPQQHTIDLANQLLAKLLNWTTDEVSCLTAQLPTTFAQSMEAVDWVMRCQASCKSTGISASALLATVALTSNSPTSAWKTVGEALIAARH